VALLASPAGAQIDYRNLDRGRPIGVEDAYPIERYGFEVAGGYRISRVGPGRAQQMFEPELSFGAGAALGLAVELPLAITERDGGSEAGLAGLHLSAKYNISTERPWMPGLGLRFDGVVPVGSEAGSGLESFASILATRSFGRNRLHLNAGAGLWRPEIPAAVDPLPEWRVGLAVDHTLLRTSTLLIVELIAEQEWDDSVVSILPGIGFRRQLTPTLVLDGGVGFEGPSFTIGLSHAFGIAGLMPGVRR
jgi:hypothetical protein